jgi:thioredoxin-related protein
MALASPMVTADAVEATEFPELSGKYRVSGVPHTVINEGAGNMIGAAPEYMLVEEIKKALKN